MSFLVSETLFKETEKTACVKCAVQPAPSNILHSNVPKELTSDLLLCL